MLVLAVLLVALLAVVLPNADVLIGAQLALADYAVGLMILRLTLIILIWMYWARFCECLYHDRPVPREYLRQRRHFFLGVFLAIELLLIQNVLGRLWDLVGGGAG